MHLDKKIPQETEQETKQETNQSRSNTETQELFSAGLHFFQKLATALDDPTARENTIRQFIETDEKTGKQSIKIPVPDKDTIEKASNIL